MELKQICREILEEAKKNNVQDLRKFNHIKLQVLSRLNYSKIPKNATIASLASDEDRKQFKKILSMKPVRTISGVAPIALMADPYPCPHTIKGIGPCTYCPGGPGSVFGDVPQSYTGKEPSTRRAIRNLYDPYLGVFNRLEHYVAMNSVPEKCEVILQGGTFPFYPKHYQDYFVKYLLKAMNDFSMLFYNENGMDLGKFNKFFELPADIDNEQRTRSIQGKLLFIKNLDLNDEKILWSINHLFFNNKNNNGLKNELIAQWGNFNEKNYNETKNSNENNDYNNLVTIKSYSNNKINTIFNNSLINNNLSNNKKITNNFKNDKLKSNNSNENNSNPNIAAMKRVLAKVNERNDRNSSLEQIQKENETAKIRCIGLTIETKSDYGKLAHGNQMLRLGCTRIELGIQSVYDGVLEKTNRGNTVQDNIDSIRILKDLGFKINAHYMPGLPFTTKEMDKKGLRELFANPDYRPDMLKIYPCMVMPGTKLYDDWKAGKFSPMTTKEAAELIAEMFSYVPEWCRIMRVQRDIPTYATASGVDRTNLRQYVEKLCNEKGIKPRDIRAREAGFNKLRSDNINLKNLRIKVIEYEASHGKEFFIAAEDGKNDVLFGYCRLRFPSQSLREEITKDSALIRELHVYSLAVSIGKKSEESFQHRGIGKKLMKNAEEIVKSSGKNKVVVISGIGAREYFAKLGYKHDGPYMSKMLNLV
ncbi:tRNA uridine(34) 5-carboxymethylaminomethyl modification radical SAM/GNAT enzyme Elp3 [Candidatus Woesearchaeota archaeon]|nr:tRNA uridine(34) 5-carboxymethylaminomethyl modification radical SAM/GNAT enzyme Elp3 [Candidatus Woesearchaeota archaeon]